MRRWCGPRWATSTRRSPCSRSTWPPIPTIPSMSEATSTGGGGISGAGRTSSRCSPAGDNSALKHLGARAGFPPPAQFPPSVGFPDRELALPEVCPGILPTGVLAFISGLEPRQEGVPMTRRVLVVLSLVGLAACSGEPSQPSEPVGGPAFAIVDASDPGGRPDFAWRPPIASTNIGGTFDGTRQPTVRICLLNANLDACVDADNSDPDFDYVLTASVPVVNSNYQYDWMVPVSSATHYRIFIEAGDPAVILGFADVKTATTSKALKPNDPNEFVGVTDGSILPIKFRITDACDNANCGDGFIDTQQGGTAYYTEDGETVGGVTIVANPGGGVVRVEIARCDSLPIPNPKFGSCLDIDAENQGGTPYVGPGVAFVCDALQDASDADLNEAEVDSVTLYKKHGTDPVEALDHADDACPEPEVIGGSVKGLLRALVHGKWKKAGQQLTGLLAPTPLYARRLDAGAGGEIDAGGFSLFQFAQPCVAGVGANANNQAANAAFSS